MSEKELFEKWFKENIACKGVFKSDAEKMWNAAKKLIIENIAVIK